MAVELCRPFPSGLTRILNILPKFDANILADEGDVARIRKGRAGWVLVGGRSSRMGVDKATADSDGRALALRVADRIAGACGQVSLVGDPLIYSQLGLPVVADSFPGQGPLAGIEAALAASTSDNNLIVACDMPSISENLPAELFLAAEKADCVVPRHEGGRLEPLCAVYHRHCHPVVLRAIQTGVRKVTDILPLLEANGFAVRYVRVSDPTSFENLNTPEDWHRYHRG